MNPPDQTPPSEETPESIKTQRDVLLKIVQNAQRGEQEAENTLKLLITAGHVFEYRVEQARALAKL